MWQNSTSHSNLWIVAFTTTLETTQLTKSPRAMMMVLMIQNETSNRPWTLVKMAGSYAITKRFLKVNTGPFIRPTTTTQGVKWHGVRTNCRERPTQRRKNSCWKLWNRLRRLSQTNTYWRSFTMKRGLFKRQVAWKLTLAKTIGIYQIYPRTNYLCQLQSTLALPTTTLNFKKR